MDCRLFRHPLLIGAGRRCKRHGVWAHRPARHVFSFRTWGETPRLPMTLYRGTLSYQDPPVDEGVSCGGGSSDWGRPRPAPALDQRFAGRARGARPRQVRAPARFFQARRSLATPRPTPSRNRTNRTTATTPREDGRAALGPPRAPLLLRLPATMTPAFRSCSRLRRSGRHSLFSCSRLESECFARSWKRVQRSDDEGVASGRVWELRNELLA